ncbi:MAG: hypothetical protein OEZ33_05675 [Gammaproteobacteria bacterium]|nr:hypothetical protein [Gammaproteobacteria bacterium]
MTECCGPNPNLPKKYHYPVNGKEYNSVGIKTVLHHVARPWQKKLDDAGY